MGVPVEVAGVSARSYRMPDGITVYLASVDDHVIIASSEAAIEGATRAKRKGASVRDDQAFAASSRATRVVVVSRRERHPWKSSKIVK